VVTTPQLSPKERQGISEGLRSLIQTFRIMGPIFTVIAEALAEKFPELAEPEPARPELVSAGPVDPLPTGRLSTGSDDR
jgi:hypothetical protein